MIPQRPLAVAAACAVAVAALGGATTDTGTWYRNLEKSSLTPPDWLFPIAWTLIYALCVGAAAYGWRASGGRRDQAWLLCLFFVNAILNVLWSAAFFTAQRPDWALAEVITLWLSVVALIAFLTPRSRFAGALLAPYLVWVSFAAFLNYRVVALNGPFA